MNITEVRIRKTKESSDSEKDLIMAYASITIDDIFVIHDIKIVRGKNGPFIAMPSRKDADGIHHDIAHPIRPETRLYIHYIQKQIHGKKTQAQ